MPDTVPPAVDTPPRRSTWRWRVPRAIEFVAVVVGMLAVMNEFWVERPKDRDFRDVRLHAAIATLASHENSDATSGAVQKVLGLMHEDKVDMTAISIPNVLFRMADFDVADWSDAYMKAVSFECTDRFRRLIKDHEPNEAKLRPCAQLRHAQFFGATLRDAQFDYANLSNARFNNADLTEAAFEHTVLTEAEFYGATLSGIEILSASLSKAKFSNRTTRSAVFDCQTLPQLKCTRLEQVKLPEAELHRAVFRGATISDVDFTNSTLSRSRFECESSSRESQEKQRCTKIDNVCFQDADLTRAKFENVEISRVAFAGGNTPADAELTDTEFEDVQISLTDFRGADLANTSFKNVTFVLVAISDEQIAAAEFDQYILASLYRGRVDLVPGSHGVPKPCTLDWHRDLTQWQDMFMLEPLARSEH